MALNPLIKGIAGVRPKILDFLYFEICFSPTFLLSKMGSFVVQKWILLILWSFPWGRGHKKSSKTLIRENLANFHIKRSSPGNLQAHKVCFWYEWFRYLPKWPISAKFQILTRHKILKNQNFKNSCNRIVYIISGCLHAKF